MSNLRKNILIYPASLRLDGEKPGGFNFNAGKGQEKIGDLNVYHTRC